MKKEISYYLGLDIGSDSVGYAVTNENYDLLKFKSKQAWGVTVFNEGMLKSATRSYRSSRRRLDRRQQRVALLQELFAAEICTVDPKFFIRIKESNLYREDTDSSFTLFNDNGFTDKEYYDNYPTIHHLIYDLMNDASTHDPRLVYLACAWLVAHRGHFFQNIDINNLSSVKNFDGVYSEFIQFFENNQPWNCNDVASLGEILKKKNKCYQ